MAQFPILRLTRAGQDLVGMSQGGGKLIFVRVELGDGQLGEGESVEMLHALKRRVMQLPLQGYLNEGNGKARLRFVVDNSSLTAGFFNREIGIVAKMEGGDEQLYAYTNAGNYADYIPSKDTPIDSEIIDLHIVIGNASHVVLQTQNGAYATKIDLEEHRTAAELDHPERSVRKKHLHQDAYESPALTGTPTAPTAVAGTNNTQIASTAFVAQAIAALVNSSPSALDTLQELAAALGNDANFATTMTNALAGKLGKTETAARAAELVGWSLERNRTYAVGDIAYHKDLPSWARLECVKAGTTAGSLPSLPAINRCGVMVTDGSVVWIVDDLRDGTPVGVVRGSLYVPAGYVKANGAAVQRADYPRLVALADRYSLWTSDVPRDPGLFGRADGSTTMVLPNWIDRMVQLSECNNGTEYGKGLPAGLPNITGQFAFQEDNATQSQGYGFARVNSATGAFQGIKRESWHRMLSANVLTDEDGDSSIEFNASKSNPIYGQSNTVQPAAIQLIPIIKY